MELSERARAGPCPNVWLGVSVEDQKRADERIPFLLDTPATVRFLSAEPLLGPLSLLDCLSVPHPLNLASTYTDRDAVVRLDINGQRIDGIDWVIVGGESGPRARPMRLEWLQNIINQCRGAGVPCFVKQLGARPIFHQDDTELFFRDRKGGNIAEWPVRLRIRETPA